MINRREIKKQKYDLYKARKRERGREREEDRWMEKQYIIRERGGKRER